MLKRCVQSLPSHYETIVVVNDGIGMGKAINKGFELATGDYLVTLSNDCWWVDGTFQELCDPTAVTLPEHLDGQWDKPRCFYCLPRWIYEQVGGYDERFNVGYFEDDDFIHRLYLADIPIKETVVQGGHVPGQTLDKLPNRNEIYNENKEKFKAKWGCYPSEL
jgi:glycosyltransferase involved in cell wall biosynthesis